MYTPGTLFDNRYLLKEQKGRGSFGEVWLASDQQVGVDFAIKIYVSMSPQGLEDFRKEYQLSCNLINSNLLHINHMGVCQQDSRPYLVMPYCPVGSTSLIGHVDEPTLWKYMHDVANGLSYLHTQNPPIIHQDIKPDNILQTQNGDFVITDFGISKQMCATHTTASNDTRGAMAYMGPERFARQSLTTKASDIWSLGVTMYELATGELPFEGRGGVMLAAGAEIPDLPKTFSKKLNDIVASCLAKDPKERPTATQLVDLAAAHIRHSNTTQTKEPPFVVKTRKSTSTSRPYLIVLCAVLMVAVIGYLSYAYLSSSRENEVTPPPVPISVEPEPVQVEPIPVAEDPVEIVTDIPVEEEVSTPVVEPVVPEVKEEPKPVREVPAAADSPASHALNLGYATWHGPVQNGKPHGQGAMTFSRDYDLQGHAIKAGDTVSGECVNGQLYGYCKWHSSLKGDKSILLGE